MGWRSWPPKSSALGADRRRQTPPHSTTGSRQGYTLLTVLTVIVALSIAAYSLIKLADAGIPLSGKEQKSRREYQAAKGGIEYLLEQLQKEQFEQEWLNFHGREIEVGSQRVQLSIADEGSRINVNAATEKLLRGLRLSRGQVDALLDWRDLDNNPRANGAEADYYLAQDEPVQIRNGLFPTKEELLLVRFWQGEERLIARQLTVSGPLNINSMSYEAFDALLAAIGVDEFASVAIVNDFIEAKSRGALWHDLESFYGSLPSLGLLLGQKLSSQLTAEPQVNVNTASERVLAAWCYYLDLGSELARWIVWRREAAPFEDLTEILERVPQKAKLQLPLFFTTQSSIFSLEARAGKTWIRAIAKRKDGELEILAWYTGSEGEDSD